MATSQSYKGKLPQKPSLSSTGLAAGKKPSQFSEAELRLGIQVEQEHTKNNALAMKIAMDHLEEDSQYYSKVPGDPEMAAHLGAAKDAQKYMEYGGEIKLTKTAEEIGEVDKFEPGFHDYYKMGTLFPKKNNPNITDERFIADFGEDSFTKEERGYLNYASQPTGQTFSYDEGDAFKYGMLRAKHASKFINENPNWTSKEWKEYAKSNSLSRVANDPEKQLTQFDRAKKTQMKYNMPRGQGKLPRGVDAMTYADGGMLMYEDGGVIQPQGDPWEYKKSGKDYLTRKKGSDAWITATGRPQRAIAVRVFGEDPATGKVATQPTQLQEATITGQRPVQVPPTMDFTTRGQGPNPLADIQQKEMIQPSKPTEIPEVSITGKKPTISDPEASVVLGKLEKSTPKKGRPTSLPEVTIVGKKPSKALPTIKKKDNSFMGVDLDFAKDFYSQHDVKKDHIYIVDKPSGNMYRLNIKTNKVDNLGEVGLGRNVGDRDISGGRSTGQGSNMTQSGWSKINRMRDYPNRSEDYGDKFYGFSGLTDKGWKDIPTGIHGSMNETCGRVSGGCTRMPGALEEDMADEFGMNTLMYYTPDQKEYGGDLMGLPEYGFGSWLGDNAGKILKTAGGVMSAIPVFGQIAGPIVAGAGIATDAIVKGVRNKKLLADQEEEGEFDERVNDISNSQVNGPILGGYAEGGQIGQGTMSQNPQIVNYSKGNTHQEGVGGIPVDVKGNPSTVSKQSAVGMTEKGEVTWNGYVFSDKLKV